MDVEIGGERERERKKNEGNHSTINMSNEAMSVPNRLIPGFTHSVLSSPV